MLLFDLASVSSDIGNWFKENYVIAAILAAVLVVIIALLIAIIVLSVKVKKKAKAEVEQAEPEREETPAEREEEEAAPAPAEEKQAAPAPEPTEEPVPMAEPEPPAAEEKPVEEPAEAIEEPKNEKEEVPMKKEEKAGKTPAAKKPAPAKKDEAPKKDKGLVFKPAPAVPAAPAAPAKEEKAKVSAANGKWVIEKANGKYWLSLIAPNGQVMLESPAPGYATLPSARSGIKTYQDNIAAGRLEITEHKNGDFQVLVLNARHGLLAASSTYSSRNQAESASASIKRWAATGVTEEIDG